MAENTDKTRRELLQAELDELREKGIVDGDAEQRMRGYFAESEAEPEPQPAAKTEPENPPVAPPKTRRAKRGILWYVFAAMALIIALNVALIAISIVALFAGALTGSDALFYIFRDAGRASISIMTGISRSINAVDSAVSALIEFFSVMSSTFWRVALVFIPVIAGVCCGVYTIVKDKGQVWREVSAVLTAAGFALLTWQIPRIHGVSGTSHGFLMLALAVSLPLVYIFRSSVLAALYCAFHLRFIHHILSQRVLSESVGWVDGGFIHFLGIAPFIAYYLFFHKPADSRTIGMRYISLMPLTCLLVCFSRAATVAVNLFAAAGLLYTAGLHCDETDTGDWIKPREDNGMSQFSWILIILAPWLWLMSQTRGRNPWIVCGFLSMSGLLAAAITWPGFLQLGSFFQKDAVSAGYSLYGLFLALFAAQVFITSRRPTPLKIIIGFATLTPLFCHLFRLQPENAAWAAGAALLLIGAAALAEGLKRNNRVKANIGMLQMMAVFVAVDFTGPSGGAYLLNSTILLAITVALIVMNLKMKRNPYGEVAGAAEGWKEYGDAE